MPSRPSENLISGLTLDARQGVAGTPAFRNTPFDRVRLFPSLTTLRGVRLGCRLGSCRTKYRYALPSVAFVREPTCQGVPPGPPLTPPAPYG
jgi:hypothetical protein